MLEEEAKAVQEVAKTTGKAIDALTAAGGTLKEVFGDSLNQFGGIVADWARYLRYRNLLNVADKFDQLVKRRSEQGKLHPLPPQFLLPWIDGASSEGEESVQALWAGLLANTTRPAPRMEMKKIYIEILRGLQPLDAEVLKSLTDDGLNEAFDVATGSTLNASVLADRVGAELDDVMVSLQTLARYGCVLDSWENTIDALDSGYAGFRVNNPRSNFRLSHLGARLTAVTSSNG